jgi:hypothetical protein
MRHLLTVVVVLAAISFATPAEANIFGLFGFDCCGKHNCGCKKHAYRGCGCGTGCGCGCACEAGCGCEQGCGCEPACGCGTGCYANGRQYAGQKYRCGCESHVPICPCTGCDGCGQGCCEPACGCGCGSACEPACGCGSGCEPCRYHKCCLKHCGFCSGCGYVVSALCCGNSSCGCNGEVYWNEWHNDPPRCQDPCNCNGNWIGPSSAPYGCGPNGCGPYGGYFGGPYGANSSTNQPAVAQNSRPNQSRQMRTAARAAYRPQGNAQQRPIQW